MDLRNAQDLTRDLPDAFFLRVIEVSSRVQCDPVDLLRVMTMESGIRGTTRNKVSGAIGILQFTPISNESTGLSEEERRALASVSETRQLDYVERYLVSVRRDHGVVGPLSRVGLYQAVLCPKSLRGHQSDDAICYAAPSRGYEQNSGLDRAKKGSVTVGDLRPFVDQADRIPRFQAARERLLSMLKGSSGSSGSSGEGVAVLALGCVALSFFFGLWKARFPWS